MELELDAVKKKIDSLLVQIDPEWKVINIHSFIDCFSSPQSPNYDTINFNRKVYFGKSFFEYQLKNWIYDEFQSTKPLAEIKNMTNAYRHYTTTAGVLEQMGLSEYVDFGNDALKVYQLESNRLHVFSSVFHALLISLSEDSIRITKESDLKALLRWVFSKLLRVDEVMMKYKKNHSLFLFDDTSYKMKLMRYFQKQFQKEPFLKMERLGIHLFEVTIYHHNRNSIGYAQGHCEELAVEEACLRACEYLLL